MVSAEPVGEVRFGRTAISATTGDLLDQGVAAVVVPANPRGLMGAVATTGIPGLCSFGGSGIEREAMAQAPLDLGSVLLTGASGLESRGVAAVLHAVVHPRLGEPARLDHVRRAVAAVVTVAAEHRLRSLALPLLGVEGWGGGTDDPTPVAQAVVDELVGGLRRGAGRLDRVVVVCRHHGHQAAVSAAIGRARERAWTRP